ncbi:MAG: TPM domain-containing protein [Rhodospirillales bacterium]|nr:TPM domain-containing protein [Rhodospirillales bacterium]
MTFLTASDRERIEAAVAAAEARTAAEFVTVVTPASGRYLYLPTLAAAAATLALSGVALLIPWSEPPTLEAFFLAQVGGFSALFALFAWRVVRHRLVPRAEQAACAKARAHQLFLDLGLAATRDRTGVLFFVSVGEHYVEIVTDVGIKALIDDATWVRTVERFTQAVGHGRIADGFIEAIEACGRVLAERLPVRPDDRNELPDCPVEV